MGLSEQPKDQRDREGGNEGGRLWGGMIGAERRNEGGIKKV